MFATLLYFIIYYCIFSFQTLPDGKKIKLPPVILGSIGNDSSKKTVCIYGHLDVQPAAIEDGWDTEPFVLTRKDDKLYGRGSSDDKGPVLAFIHAIEALQKSSSGLPVNVKVSIYFLVLILFLIFCKQICNCRPFIILFVFARLCLKVWKNLEAKV